MVNPTPQHDPAFEAARKQLEAEAYDPVEQDQERRGPALIYSTNDVVQDAARELQAALDALIAFRTEYGTHDDHTGGRPTLEALRQIARLRTACGAAEDALFQALVLGHVAPPALAHYMEMPTDDVVAWAQSVWAVEGRSMYERDENDDNSAR